MNLTLIKSLTSLATIGVCVTFIATSLGACTPVDSAIEGTASSPNEMQDITYYQDSRTGICMGMAFNRYEGTFAVECTPAVMKLIRGEAPTPEIAR